MEMQIMCDLLRLLTRCEEDTAKLLGQGAANRLANWRQYTDNQAELVAFIQRVLRGDNRSNGWELDKNGGLSLECIVIEHCPELFTQDDIREAKETLGIKD
jgi:hypothetical protein